MSFCSQAGRTGNFLLCRSLVYLKLISCLFHCWRASMQTTSAIPIFPDFCTTMLVVSCLSPDTLYLFISALPKTGPYIAPEVLPVLSRMYHLRSIPIYISQDNIWHFHRSMIQLAHLTTSVICQNSSQSFLCKLSKNCHYGLMLMIIPV